MKKNKIRIKKDDFDSLLSSVGFQFPKTENELSTFEYLHKNFNHKLSGLEIVPQNLLKELKDQELVKHSDLVKKKPQNNYFKRAVLAAKIASELHAEPTFGHVKFQKIVYLCEYKSQMNLTDRYKKKAAGPLDHKFMHSIDKEFMKQKWFNVERTGKFKKFKYTPLNNVEKFQGYYKGYFGKFNENIEYIINLFREEKTIFVELVTTIFACWLEIIEEGEKVTTELITKKLYGWSPEKKKYSQQELDDAIVWMKKNNLTPSHQ